MTDTEIMEFIFETGEQPLTIKETGFRRALNKERKKRGYTWRTGMPYDYMSMGIYIGIKHMLNLYKKESKENDGI